MWWDNDDELGALSMYNRYPATLIMNILLWVMHLRYDTTKEHQDNIVQNEFSEGVEEEDWIGATVSLATKLDYRWIDLRVLSNQVAALAQ